MTAEKMFSTVTKPVEHDTSDAAQRAALEEAASSGGRVFPCIAFYQGDRLMLSTSFPLPYVERHVKSNPATKGTSPRESTNRPLIPEHARSIKDYIVANPQNYILPPVTLNVRVLPSVHVQASNAPTRAAWMVVHDSTVFYVTDGQHRIAALTGYPAGRGTAPGALDEVESLSHNGLAVLIVYERDISRTHQDFADAAQTKPIPASLLAVYNTREPVNRVLAEIVDRSALLKGRIDETSKTLPKMSQHIFLLNQVRGMVKELLVSDYAMAEDSLSRHAKQLIGTTEQQDEFIRRATELIDTLTEHMEPWNAIVGLPHSGGVANRIPDLRGTYVNLTATGLNIIGRLGYEIGKDPSESARRDRYVDLAKRIDWKRDAPIWLNNIISEGGKISTQRAPVAAAVAAVRKQLGL